MTRIVTRRAPPHHCEALERDGVHPLLARIYAGRGVTRRSDIDYGLSGMLDPAGLHGIDKAAALLADAISDGRSMLIVADYDCDGATACAVGVRALRALGGRVDYIVPNRFTYGYGLTPEIVALAAERRPDLIITVDNGIASVDGVAAARARGIRTLITDHHLPGAELPAADAIVNPNQPGCEFASKNLAGVGVMFYVALATRAELRRRGRYTTQAEPKLAAILDLVALGTVADLVRLDRNNRLLVAQGLERIRDGRAQPGLRALLHVGGRNPMQASAHDLGFAAGPRVNAAGRLSDMHLGIECLISDDFARALNIAQQLDVLNEERRGIEADMRERADEMVAGIDPRDRVSITLFDPTWHQGVVGLVAGKLKERLHRPVIAFARAGDELKGSGRAIPGLHLRDALDLVAKRAPGLVLRFGGHAAAAGLSIREADFARFEALFEAAVSEMIDPAALSPSVETDGGIELGHMSLPVAHMLRQEVWGQGFPAPIFADEFTVESQRVVKDKHLKLTLRRDRARFDAIRFNHADAAPARLMAAYRLAVNEFQGSATLQLVIEHFATT